MGRRKSVLFTNLKGSISRSKFRFRTRLQCFSLDQSNRQRSGVCTKERFAYVQVACYTACVGADGDATLQHHNRSRQPHKLFLPYFITTCKVPRRLNQKLRHHSPSEPASAGLIYTMSDPMSLENDRIAIPRLKRSEDRCDASESRQRVSRACTNVCEFKHCMFTISI